MNDKSLDSRTTILLVGAERVGKHTLAKALILAAHYPLQIRTATQFPLSFIENGSLPRNCFVVFMIDVTSRDSLKIVEDCMESLSGKEYIGSTCLVALKVKCPERRAIDLDVVKNLSEQHQCDVYYGSLENDGEKEILARQIVRVCEIACGLKHNVTPLLIQSTRIFSDLPTS